MNLPSFPNRKTSNYPWLGSFPAHWVVKRLRFATERIEQGWSPQCDNQAADDDAWGVMKVGCVNGDQFDASENKALPPELDPKTEYELRPGDVLISRANTRDLVGSAAIVPSDVRAKLLLCDKLFRIALSPEVDAAYLTFCLRTRAARYQYEQDATGASGSMQNIGQDAVKNLVLPFPSYSEQQQIAAFLDWKTSQIDALIAKKQTLLQKLKEKRLAVITQAVTKGLNPDAPLRDSGIAWLGEVPTHWEVKRLKWAIMLQRGHDLPADERGQGDVPLVSSAGISAFHDVAIARAPGIVTGRYGTIGVFHLIEEDYWPLNTTLYSIDMFGNDPKFLRALLESLSPLFLLNSKKSAVPGVDRNDVHLIEVALPSLEEQNQIAAYISTAEVRHEQVTKNAESAITRLTEYRSALITAATTGKIDVRNVAIPAHA